MNLSFRSGARKKVVPLAEPIFKANAGPQAAFVTSDVFEILYGGRAGGGKAHDLDEQIETDRGCLPVGELVPGMQLCEPGLGGYVPLEAINPQGMLALRRFVLESGASVRLTLGHISLCRIVEPREATSDLAGPVSRGVLLNTLQIQAILDSGLAVYLPLSAGQEVVARWSKIAGVEDLGVREASCLSVSGSGLYVASGIATHNSAGLLIGAYRHLQHYGHPQHNAIIFRRSHAEIKRAPVFQLAMQRFTALQQAGYHARWNGQDMSWDFGAHGRLFYGYLEAEHDHLRYQGPEFVYIGWDELTHIRPKHYKYMFTRLRGQPGTPCVVRGGTNPGGPYHKFYFQRFRPWLDRSEEYLENARRGLVPLADPGEVLYFLPPQDSDLNNDTAEQCVPAGTPGARSRTFIPAGIENTPQYDTKQYDETLKFADATLRAQLQEGRWIEDDSGGTFFQKSWWRRERKMPRIICWVRSYDMAWGTSDSAKFTVGTLVGLVAPGYAPENTVAVGDMISWKAHEGTSLEAIRDVAAVDTAFARAHGGAPLIIRLPDDSGKAGIDLRTKFVAHLAGYDVRLIPDRGDKFMRARPVAAQAEYGNIWLLEGYHPTRDIAAALHRKGIVTETAERWIETLINRLEKTDPLIKPDKQILDHMDSLSSACALLWTPDFVPQAQFFRPGVG